MKRCCRIIYFNYTDVDLGWDAHNVKDCELTEWGYMPVDFDSALITGASTKKEAVERIASEWHGDDGCRVNPWWEALSPERG